MQATSKQPPRFASDYAAFGAFYEAHKAAALGYVHGMVGRRSVADQIVQEIFLRAYRTRDTAPQTALSLWFWSLVRHTTLDHAPKGEGSLMPDWELQPLDEHSESSTAPETERLTMESAPRKAVEEGLAGLSTSQREVLLLRTFAQLSPEEIAQTLGIPSKAVKSLLVRAEVGLVGALKGKGYGR